MCLGNSLHLLLLIPIHSVFNLINPGLFSCTMKRIFHALDVLWGFTESDFATFLVPNMVFGLLGALAPRKLVDQNDLSSTSTTERLQRLLALLAFNWFNLLVFDLANQRSLESVAEDKLNKPWRPIPAGKISMQQARRVLLASVPMIWCLNYYLGVPHQGNLIHLITWLYNDLRGGDEAIVRELLIAMGYAMFNAGSLRIAACGVNYHPTDTYCNLNTHGFVWTGIVSAIIFTTMQVQDLKDQEGDRLRHRRSIVLHLGEHISRRTIACFVVLWSGICSIFWSVGPWVLSLLMVLGMAIAWQVVIYTYSRHVDRRTWQLWCFWLIVIYSLPIMSSVEPQ